MMSGLQVEVIAGLMRPFIGFAVTEEEDARFFVRNVSYGFPLDERIEDQVIPKSRGVLQELSEILGGNDAIGRRVPGRPDWNSAPLAVENRREYIAGGQCRHAPAKRRPPH